MLSVTRLQAAGRAVERASADLVQVATDAANNGFEGDEAPGADVNVPMSAVQRIRHELELREKITEQERELAARRAQLEDLHKAAYDKSKGKSRRR